MNVRSCSGLVAAIALSLVACNSSSTEPRRDNAGTPASPPAASQPAPQPQQPSPPQTPAPSVTPGAARPAKLAYAGELPPLPIANFPAARPPEVVKAVYEFAARRPDVLRYVPCFCGCERNGHVHNEDCFVAEREPDGKPRWDAHGMG